MMMEFMPGRSEAQKRDTEAAFEAMLAVEQGAETNPHTKGLLDQMDGELPPKV